MKYMIETTEDGCVEILELHDGSKYTKRHKRDSFGLKCVDDEFCQQMEEDGICEELLDKAFDVLDGFFPSDFLDMAELDY